MTVTNTGDTYSGKETVQIYAQSPYTEYDKENSVENLQYSYADSAKLIFWLRVSPDINDQCGQGRYRIL